MQCYGYTARNDMLEPPGNILQHFINDNWKKVGKGKQSMPHNAPSFHLNNSCLIKPIINSCLSLIPRTNISLNLRPLDALYQHAQLCRRTYCEYLDQNPPQRRDIVLGAQLLLFGVLLDLVEYCLHVLTQDKAPYIPASELWPPACYWNAT